MSVDNKNEIPNTSINHVKQDVFPIDQFDKHSYKDRETWNRRRILLWRFVKFFTLGFTFSAVFFGTLTFISTYVFYAKGMSLLNHIPYGNAFINPWITLAAGGLLSLATGTAIGIWTVIRGHKAIKKANEEAANTQNTINKSPEKDYNDPHAPGYTIQELLFSHEHTELLTKRQQERYWHFVTRFALGFLVSSVIIGAISLTSSILFYNAGMDLLNIIPFAIYVMNPIIQLIASLTGSLCVGFFSGYIALKKAKSLEGTSIACGGNTVVTTTDIQLLYNIDNMDNLEDQRIDREYILYDDQVANPGTNTLKMAMQMGYDEHSDDETAVIDLTVNSNLNSDNRQEKILITPEAQHDINHRPVL